ncbi:MAG: phosphoribosyl-ATP diphosphatase [Rhodobacteraceae bacterium]|nr:phosphoribosyl-ATP diphosphatase [Paracoccaceae bacterium]
MSAPAPPPGHPLDRLAATIAARAGADPDTSWTARLLSRGPEICARKFGEEAVETIVAALSGSDDDLTAEAADTLFHLLVLLEARGLGLGPVLAELERREGTSGIAEKAARGTASAQSGAKEL